MRMLVMDEECRILFCNIDLQELRMRALYDVECPVWQLAHLRDSTDTETDRPFKCSFPLATGTTCQFCSTTMKGLIGHKVRAHGFYDPVQRAGDHERMPLVSLSLFHAIGRPASCVLVFSSCSCRTGGSNAHTVIRQPQLPVECPLCKKTDAANHESKSLSPSCDESSLPKFSSVSDYYDHIIRCHLSLPGPPCERFAKVAQPCWNSTVPAVRPFAVGIARRPVINVSRRGPDEGGTKTKWRGPLRPKECHRKPETTEPKTSSGDPQMMAAVSHSTADGMHGSERTLGSQPVESLSHRFERIELLNDHRDELLLQCAQSRRLLESFLCRTWLVEGDVASFQTVRSSQSTGKGVQRETPNGAALHVSVRGVRQWPDDGGSWINRTGRGRDGVAARVSQEAHLGTGRGSFPRDVEHSRDPPERRTSTHSGTI